MGNHCRCKQTQASYFYEQDWQPTKQHPYGQILTNKYDGHRIQKWISNKQKNAVPLTPLVLTYDLEVNSLLSANSPTSYLITAVYTPLHELELSIGEGVYVMYQILKHYKAISRKYGAFKLASNNIFINESGEVYIWVSSNLANNEPAVQNINMKQEDIVKQMAETVQSCLQRGQKLPKLRMNIRQNEQFYRNVLVKNYGYINHISIPCNTFLEDKYSSKKISTPNTLSSNNSTNRSGYNCIQYNRSYQNKVNKINNLRIGFNNYLESSNKSGSISNQNTNTSQIYSPIRLHNQQIRNLNNQYEINYPKINIQVNKHVNKETKDAEELFLEMIESEKIHFQ